MSQQVALCLAGVHTGEASKVVLDGARVDACGIHLDSGDGNRVEGVPLVYGSDRQYGETEPLPHTDLVVFENETGGRGVRITTSDPGYLCVVTMRADRQLHCNVFPDSLVLPCVPGCLLLRLIPHCLRTVDRFCSLMVDDPERWDWPKVIAKVETD